MSSLDSTGTPEPAGQAPYAASAESTPLPLPNTPSTTFSYPYRVPATTQRRARSSHGHGHTSDSGVEPKGRARTTNGGPRRHHRSREEPSVVTFDEHAGLTKDQIQKAASLTVIAQSGIRVQFGELFKDRKTIVIFIRHFWCAMCQDYMYSIARNVDFEALKSAGIEVVVIGNGSHGMIKSYRNIFRMPISLYTDPTLRLYAALGMTLRNNDPGPDSEKGEYVRHGPIGGLAMVVRNAIRVGMPVWERGGDTTQLGGEFVLGPGFNCSYAHRMTTTRSHAPIREVLRATGYHRVVSAAGMKPEGLNLSPEEEETWMEERRRSFARMRAKREKRREIGTPAGNAPELYEPELGYGSDTGSGSISVNGSWSSSVEKEAQLQQVVHQRERSSHERTRERRGTKGLHVSNPDDSHYDLHEHRERHEHHKRVHAASGRVHVAQHDVGPNEWSGGLTPTLSYINQYGRREDGYETEDGALGYNYRQD
ncbi:AhpC/TSA antioxidant enzyme-domain-containing protein [Earliella scabrosa]|nr:AhpC/TSA antioxidant enzyme-domain-containing protein [Earliella scabrosa]